VSLDPPKSTFSGDYISAPKGCRPLKFLHALEIDQVLLVHTTNRVGVRVGIVGVGGSTPSPSSCIQTLIFE